MEEIKGYNNYFYDGKDVYKCKKKITKTKSKNKPSFKMKSNKGIWKRVSETTVKGLTSYKLKIPKHAVRISENDFIDKQGNIYNFGLNNRNGIIKKHKVGTNGYPSIGLVINGKHTTVAVHQLLADSFIHKGYIAKGLCCLHKDNNKLNFNMDNLSVGTYSKNNKDAYTDGINKGNIKGVNK